MDEMLALLGNHPPCLLFKQLFLERLPEDIRTQLIAVKHENCRAMAKQEDLLWSAKEVAITNMSEELEETNYALFFSRRNHQPLNPTSNQNIIFYHRKWGKETKRSQNPCAWPSKRAGQPQVMAAVAGLKDCLLVTSIFPYPHLFSYFTTKGSI